MITIISNAIRHTLHDLPVGDAMAITGNILDRLKNSGVRFRVRRRR